MCQLMLSFRLYSENTQIHPDYYRVMEVLCRSGEVKVIMESESDYRTRINAKCRKQNAVNREHNAHGKIQHLPYGKDHIVAVCQRAELQASGTRHLSAAERKAQYQ